MAKARLLGDGSDTLRQRMRVPVVALTLAKHAPAFAILFLPPAIWAAAEGAWLLAGRLAWPLVIALAVYLLVARRPLPDDLRAAEAMASVAAVFLIAALAAMPAFIALGFTPIGALFEAMSGVTTTGLSVAADAQDWPFAAHVLRAWLQWVGGLVMATAVLALILPAGHSTQRLGEAGIDQGDRIASTRSKARQLLTVYAALTLVMTAATLAVIPDWREAVVLTLSAVSTGGFAPRPDSLASYTPLAQGVVILTCTLGSVSLLTYVLALKGDWSGAWKLGSLRRVIVTLAVLSVIAGLVLLANGSEGPTYGALLNLVSAMTTAGYSTSAMPGGALLAVLILAMLLGGDSGSTAGGLKLARAGVLISAFRHALRAPSLPDRAVTPLRTGGSKVEDGTIVALVALIFVYIATLFALVLHFTLRGYPMTESLFDAVSALSTVGLSTGVIGPDLPWDLQLSVTLAMWLGRLEFIAVLVLLWPRNWMKGH